MDTGNTYIRGKVGINYDPETSQNDYKLRVSGNTYHNGDVYFGGANDLGIYYEGTNTISRVIRFIDNIDSDGGNGISVGYGGLTILGSGESTNTVINGLRYADVNIVVIKAIPQFLTILFEVINIDIHKIKVNTIFDINNPSKPNELYILYIPKSYNQCG